MSQNPFDTTNLPEETEAIPPTQDYSDLDDEWGETEAATGGESVPDGAYQCRIVKASQGNAQSSGVPLVKWDLIVLNGDYNGRHIFKTSSVKKETLKFLKGDLTTIECCPKKLSELHLALQDATGRDVEVKVVTKEGKDQDGNPRDFTNVYFNKLLTGVQDGNGGEPYNGQF